MPELDASKTGLSPNFLTTRAAFEHDYRGFEFNLHRRLASVLFHVCVSPAVGKATCRPRAICLVHSL